MSSVPKGSELSYEELLIALDWKIEDGETNIFDHHGDVGAKEDNRQVLDLAGRILQLSKNMHEIASILAKFALRRNSLLWINLLPVEILSRIFEELQPCALAKAFSDPNLHLTNSSHSSNLRILMAPWAKTMTSVCLHWRRVAFSNPKFFQFIPIGIPINKHVESFALIYFQRSSPLPIHLRFDSFGPDYLYEGPQNRMMERNLFRFLMALVQSPERLKTFTFFNPNSDTINPIIPQILRQKLSNLESLGVTCRGDQQRLPNVLVNDAHNGVIIHEEPNLGLDELISRIDAPRLTKLSLSFPLSIPSPLLPTLTYLQIVNPRFLCQADDMLAMLQTTPLLQSLFLMGESFYVVRDATALPIVHLPHLKEFELEDKGHPSEEPFLLLWWLIYPSSARATYHYKELPDRSLSPSMIPPSRLANDITHLIIDPEVQAITITSNSIVSGKYSELFLRALPNIHVLAYQTPSWNSSSLDLGFKLQSVQTYHCFEDGATAELFSGLDVPELGLFPQLLHLVIWSRHRGIELSLPHLIDDDRFKGSVETLRYGAVVKRSRANGTAYDIRLLPRKQSVFEVDWLLGFVC